MSSAIVSTGRSRNTLCSPRAEQRLPAALADVYARYERRRTAGRHEGPPLSAVRLYQLRWALDADARNAQHPDVRELLYEHRPDR